MLKKILLFISCIFILLPLSILAEIKTEDLKETTLDNQITDGGTEALKQPQGSILSKEDQQKIEEAIHNYQKKVEESNKALKELDENN